LPLVLVIMVCSPLPRFELTGLQSVASDHVDRWGGVKGVWEIRGIERTAGCNGNNKKLNAQQSRIQSHR